jgi:hypothetical protein
MKRALLVAIIWAFSQPVLAQERRITIPGLFSLDLNAPVPEDFGDKLMESLLPSVEWKAEGLSFGGGPVRAYQVTYPKGGSIISVDRAMAKGPCRFSIHIERPLGAKTRHKVMVGTDLAEYEIIRRDPPTSDGEPFARTYLFHLPNTASLRGFAFYEGTWAELQCEVLMPDLDVTKTSVLKLTWNMARRLPNCYAQQIAPIAKSIDDGSPEVTRPDLPDADARPDTPTRKRGVVIKEVPD